MTPHYFFKNFKITSSKNQPKGVVLAFAFFLIAAPFFVTAQPAAQKTNQVAQNTTKVLSAKKINTTTIELLLSDKQTLTLDFYGDNIFRLFEDPTGGFIRDPEAKPEAKILVENPRRAVSKLDIKDENNQLFISTAKI